MDLKGQLEKGEAMPGEPFLAPARRFDLIGAGEPDEWVAVAILETLVRVHQHSSLFGGSDILPTLDRLAHSKYASPEMERRWHLMRLKSGQVGGAQPSGKLTEPHPGHQNAELWRGDGFARWAQ